MTIPTEMYGIDARQPGGPEVLQYRSFDVPQAAPGEVLIRVAAAGINAPDLMQRRGRYDPPPGHSAILGLEVGGEIVALGEGSTGFALGDQVVALCNGGGYAEYAAVPGGQVLPLPANWNVIGAAALPETYFTIQQTLVLKAGIAAGMTVLIHGAAGGLGGAAITIAKHYDAKPIAVVSSPEKAAYAMSLGAWATIDRSVDDFVVKAQELTNGTGCDRIIDIVGGQNIAHNLNAAATGGHILQLATLEGPRAEINAGQIVAKHLTISGSTLRPRPPGMKAAIALSLRQDIWPALGDGRIAPPRIRRFAFEEVSAAHQAMEERGNYGKIVLLTSFGQSLALG
jgi:NADPH2:quinone reductase